MKICNYCGTTIACRWLKNPYNKTETVCSNCYQMFKRSDGIFPIPPAGEIHYSPKGNPICHICGLAVSKVLQHAYYKHSITEKEYKKKFQLNRTGILSYNSYKLARKRVFENPKCITNNLIISGEKTRYTKNDPRTKEYTMTLQELKRRKSND